MKSESIYSPAFTNRDAQQAAIAWKTSNWTDRLRIAGSDSGFCAYVAFLAGVAWQKEQSDPDNKNRFPT